MLRYSEAFALIPHGKKLRAAPAISVRTPSGYWLYPEIPLPEEADLRETAKALGLTTHGTAGLTIGYGICVRQDCMKDPNLIAHELMQVAQ